ncbi:MAG TPA: hypothetical protein VMB21_20535 [Candidatus Limnocylindria bacterium]|jgi:hypothetical protein|nr:hypothetical protein [Candidatus Limnocylindria bacterium]
MKPDPHSRLADHIVGTLPDSVAGRRALLTDLAEALPRTNGKRAAVLTVLATLDQHVLAQREFPFSEPPTDGPTVLPSL